MKIKLIDAQYNEETGISYAKVSTDYGIFEGQTKLHEEDKEYASKFVGCQYAETRAVLKYMKYRIKILAYQIKALKNCQNSIEKRVSCSPDGAECRALRKQIYILEAERADWQSKYNSLKEHLYNSMEKHSEVVKHIREKYEKGE